MSEKLAMIKPYYKYELAELYRISRRKFMYWINAFEDFKDLLLETGYTNTQHIFSQKQVEIIFDYLGHPDAISEYDAMKTHTRVTLMPYSKKTVAKLFGFSMKTLLKQLRSIPNRNIYAQIMQSESNKFVVEINNDKRHFMKDEVELIFSHLGHPYIQ